MGESKNMPGVMLYFDIRPTLNRLNNDQTSQLFKAILDYGEYGTFPDYINADPTLGVAWDFIMPKIDRDRENYFSKVEKNTEAGRKGGLQSGKARQKKKEAREAAEADPEEDAEANASNDEANEANASKSKRTKPTTASTTTPATTSEDNSQKAKSRNQLSKGGVGGKPFNAAKEAAGQLTKDQCKERQDNAKELYQSAVSLLNSKVSNGSPVHKALTDWLEYKRARCEGYKQREMTNLLGEVQITIGRGGPDAVVNSIYASMEAGKSSVQFVY